jgi:ribosomal-protein-alanine N-acetyltransferase
MRPQPRQVEEIHKTCSSQAYPRFETDRLVIRALRMDDTDFIFREWGDSTVTHLMRDEEPLKTLEQAEEMLRPLQTPDLLPNTKWWGIEIKEEKRLIGTCGYSRWDKQHHRAEIGYDMWPDYWGQGLMPEALRALIKYGFEVMELNRIEATTHTSNQRSQRVLAKLGFKREGLLRDYYCRDGKYNDQIQFSLLRGEWAGSKKVE